MVTLADTPFEELRAGMTFEHAHYGEQIILRLGRGQLGPAIHFHNTDWYSGAMPQLGEQEGEGPIFERIASRTYPRGAEEWEYLGMVSAEEVKAYGWQWFRVACPHCGSVIYTLASSTPSGGQHCRGCGMVVQRAPEPACRPEHPES